MQKALDSWYSEWFNTPFYHILYQDRGHAEAQLFMDTITKYLRLPENGTILDLACGKGRHSIYLNSIGYDVTGVDLSINSIEFAKQFENENLHFQVHNMSEPFHKKFDAVFNLFTSFGYFDHESDNLNAIISIKKTLNKRGFGVIDFMNVEKVISNLIPEEIKRIGSIDFHISRYFLNGFIFKEITFKYSGEEHHYTERVKALTLDDFKAYFKAANVDLIDVFGDYKLHKYDKTISERLVLVFK